MGLYMYIYCVTPPPQCTSYLFVLSSFLDVGPVESRTRKVPLTETGTQNFYLVLPSYIEYGN